MKNVISRLKRWIGLAPQSNESVPSQVVPPPPPPLRAPRFSGPLLGNLTRSDLEQLPGWGGAFGAAYTPDPAEVAILAAHASDVEAEVFVGTWCGDSRRELPRFFAIVDAAGWDESRISYLGLDYTKRDPQGRTAALQVSAVPTFVLFRHGAEIGRIVERPLGTLEGSLAKIVSSNVRG